MRALVRFTLDAEEESVKAYLQQLAVGVGALWLLTIGQVADARSESSIVANHASASVRFVVHVPETLSMRVDVPDGWPSMSVSATRGEGPSTHTNRSDRTVTISVRANVNNGRTIALSTDSVLTEQDLPPGHSIPPSAAWTMMAEGSNPTVLHRIRTSATGGRPAPKPFIFSHHQRWRPGPTEQPTTFTISAP